MKKRVYPAKTSIIGVLLCLTTFYLGYSQNLQKFQIPDSLKNYTYEELYNKQDLFWNDTLKAKIYINTYLHKAKNDNDTIRIADAYADFGFITENYEYGIKYFDSILSLTKKNEDFKYPGFAFIGKGLLYFRKGDYEKTLDNYLIAQKHAAKRNNLNQLFLCKLYIGNLKLFLGNYNESIRISKSIISEIEELNDTEVNSKKYLFLSSIINISNSYIYTKNLDSALIYSKKGLIESLNQKDSSWYFDFVNQTGVIAYYQNNFETALDSINKSAPYSTHQNSILNDLFYKAKIYSKQDDPSRAFSYFKKADSIYNIYQDVIPEVRDIQVFFINHYKEKNDIQNQLKYIDRLLFVDSVIAYNRIHLNETITKEYDTPLLLSEKEKIINQLNLQKKKSSSLIIGLAVLLFIALSTIFYFYNKYKTNKKRFYKLITKNNTTVEHNTNQASEKSLNISEEIVDNIISKLESFENKKHFTRNKTTLQSLSKYLNTNSNYLSKIINHYKGKNFSSYITDLRIDYCVEKIKKDSTFRKYDVKAIANEIGFNNTESFSKAFYKKTGIYPSYFIKEMEKKKM